MSDKVQLLGGPYQYELPAMPREEDILFYDKKKKDQFWIPPDLTTYKKLKISGKKEFVEQIRAWWKDGLWFMNHGEPTYITGLHFDFLSLHHFNTIETFDKKPRYYESQRHDFYFRDLTWNDIYCFGRLFLKCRRYGMTLEEIAEIYYRAVMGFGNQVGCMSNEWIKTLTSIFTPLVASMMKRPKYMRAKYYSPNNKVPQKIIKFTGSTIPQEDDDGDQEIVSEYLEGWIMPKATTVSAFDGDKCRLITLDEIFKWTNASPKETIATHRKSIEVGGRPIGKISALSTMGDSMDQEAAVRDGVELWHQSDPEILDDNGRTTSGLWRYFVSGLYMYNETHADKYGKLNEDAAYTEIMNERKKHQPNTRDYIFELRRVPLTPAEGLASATTASIFDRPRIQARLTILRKTPRHLLPFIEGTLQEENNGYVHWVPDVNGGPWKMAHMPLITKDFDGSNRWFKDYENKYHLKSRIQGSLGYDSFRMAKIDTKSNNLSRACILAKQKYDYFGNGGANRFNAIYLDRPDNPNEPTYQCFLACKFFGYKAMIERNVEKPREWFRGPTINPLGDTLPKISAQDFMEIGDDGFYGTAVHGKLNTVKDGVDMIQESIQKPKTANDIDWLMEIPFTEVLTDYDNFDPKHTTAFDVFMSNIQLEHGLKKVKYSNVTSDEDNIEPPKGINAMVPGRKNSTMP